MIWSFERRYKDHSRESFTRVLRRAECLFTLIAAYHAINLDEDHGDHGIRMVGRDKLLDVSRDALKGAQVEIGNFAALEGPQRYFKNRLGGLPRRKLSVRTMNRRIAPATR
jgi:hypothetical protein